MFIEMNCTCEASFHADVDGREEELWLMANRFIASHTNCGYMAPVKVDDKEKTKPYNIAFNKEEKE